MIERNKENYHFLKTFNYIQTFRENNTVALEISKSVKFPWDDRTDTNLIAPLRIHFKRSKSTLDSLKRLFSAFRGKPSLVAPEKWQLRGFSISQKETNSKV